MLNIFSRYLSVLKLRAKNVIIMPDSYASRDSVIGEYTYIGHRCSITKAVIGRFCSIADNVTIGPGEHKLDQVSNSSLFYENQYASLTEKNCIIGNDVWIGVDSIIRRGCIIGDGAIIEANSFVNSDVPDFAVVAGSPAKIIRYRFPEEKIKKITDSMWWDHPLAEAKNIIKNLD